MASINPADRSDKHQPLPHGAGTLAMWWFLSALAMLFGSGMLGYIAIRYSRADPEVAESVKLGTIHLPQVFWLSTAIVLLASLTIQMAVSAVRREKLEQLKSLVLITLGLGLLFCVIQTPAMVTLVREHIDQINAFRANGSSATANPFFGLVFVYVLVHALHVVGGIVHLALVAVNAFRYRYDHESYNGVKHAAMYWHFLDVVWILMFGTMLLFG